MDNLTVTKSLTMFLTDLCLINAVHILVGLLFVAVNRQVQVHTHSHSTQISFDVRIELKELISRRGRISLLQLPKL